MVPALDIKLVICNTANMSGTEEIIPCVGGEDGHTGTLASGHEEVPTLLYHESLRATVQYSTVQSITVLSTAV